MNSDTLSVVTIMCLDDVFDVLKHPGAISLIATAGKAEN
jgi:hypothetical protein